MDEASGDSVLIEVKVQSLGLDTQSQTPVVILKEADGDRVLPIWIGPGEASAIAMQLADMKFSRPLTHDLLVAVLGGLGADLERVHITKVVENTYFAELIVRRNGEVLSVDARPSDSIAVALRTQAQIFADDELLERGTIEIAKGETDTLSEIEGAAEETSDGLDAEELKEYLRKLNPEDFGRFTP